MASARRIVIINADDLGYDPAVSRGILEAMRAGVVTSATLMVNMPHSEEAARAAQGLALGLHFNLCRCPPVSRSFPSELLAEGQLSESLASRLPVSAVEEEVSAQLQRLLDWTGRRATHIDVHKHMHRHENVLAGVLRAAKAAGLPVRALDAQMRQAVRAAGIATTDAFLGDAGKDAYWTLAQLEADLKKVNDGVTELMCHPGYAPTHISSGYSGQREVELRTFTHPRARQLIDESGVSLGNFTALT